MSENGRVDVVIEQIAAQNRLMEERHVDLKSDMSILKGCVADQQREMHAAALKQADMTARNEEQHKQFVTKGAIKWIAAGQTAISGIFAGLGAFIFGEG